MFSRIIVLGLISACLASVSASETEEPWIEVRTPNFRLFSDASKQTATEIARNFESLRAVLADLQPDLRLNSPRPTYIYAFRSDERFASYKPLETPNVSGIFISDRLANYVGLGVGRRSVTSRVVGHEYLHFVLHNNSLHLPTWFDEGLAEYYSTFLVEDGVVDIGRPLMGHVQTLATRPWMTLPELFAITTQSRDYNEADRQGVFYAQSWLFAHYVRVGKPELAPRLATFLDLLAEGKKPETAFPQAFDLSMEQFLTELQAYRQRGSFLHTSYSFEQLKLRFDFTVAPLPPRDRLVRMGEFLIASRPRKGASRAEAMFQEALRLDPGHGSGHRGLGLVHRARGETDAAMASLTRAVELNPNDAVALMLLGRTTLDEFFAQPQQKREPGGAAMQRAASLFRRSANADPRSGEAQALLGHTLMQLGDCDQGLPTLQSAWQTMPTRLDVAHDLTALLARCGQADAARYLFETAIEPFGRPDVVESARDSLLSGDVERVEGLIGAGSYAEAALLLREIIPRMTHPGMKQFLQGRLAEIGLVAETNRWILRYNEGIELANQGQLARAAATMREVIAGAADPGVVADAKRVLADLRK